MSIIIYIAIKLNFLILKSKIIKIRKNHRGITIYESIVLSKHRQYKNVIKSLS